MKQLLSLLLIILFIINCSSDPCQRLEGIWQGFMSYEKYKTRTALKTRASIFGKINSVIDFPDYGSLNMPVDNMYFKGDSIYFEVPSIEGKFNGMLRKSDSTITGQWDQGEFDIKAKVILKYTSANPNQLLDYMVPRLGKIIKRKNPMSTKFQRS